MSVDVAKQYFVHCGRKVTMKQLSMDSGIAIRTLYQRYWNGDRNERLARPTRQYRHVQDAV